MSNINIRAFQIRHIAVPALILRLLSNTPGDSHMLFALRAAEAQCNPYIVTLDTDRIFSSCGELRYAINQADSALSAVTIVLNLTETDTIVLTNGGLAVKGANVNPITIDGGKNGTIIDGNASSRIFDISRGMNVTLQHLTLRNGQVEGNPNQSDGGGAISNYGTLTISHSMLSDNKGAIGGGALDNTGTLTINDSLLSGNIAMFGGGVFNGGNLTINRSTISDNSALIGGGINNVDGLVAINNSTFSGNSAPGTDGEAGAIFNDTGGVMTIRNSTISHNSAQSQGGGILNFGVIEIGNSTLSGNLAQYGGGIRNIDTLTISNSTVVGNTATNGTGGIDTVAYTPVNLFSSIVAANSGSKNAPDISGKVNSLGYNLIGDGTALSGMTDGNHHDQLSTASTPKNPNLAALTNNGGTTQTLAIENTISPAYQHGNCDGYLSEDLRIAPVQFDQRGKGQSRKIPCDIGAFEYQSQPPMIATLSGSSTVVPLCRNPYVVTVNTDSDPPVCGELRYAISRANEALSAVTITFNLAGSNRITLVNGEFAIDGINNNLITIDGGTSKVIIDGNASSRIFNIANNHNVALQALTIRNGRIITDYGGGVYNAGTLMISHSTLSGNESNFGGAVYNKGTLITSYSTFSGNDARSGGVIETDMALKVSHSTFSGNKAIFYGGGIDSFGAVTIDSSTLAGNSAQIGGGFYNGLHGTLTINNSIIVGNTGDGI